MSVIKVNTIQNANGTTALTIAANGQLSRVNTATANVSTLNATSGVLATQNGMNGIAKAWVTWSGSAGTIQESFNFSSMTKVATGRYTFSFTTAMPNITFAIVLGADIGTTGAIQYQSQITQTTTTLDEVQCWRNDNGNLIDPSRGYLAIFSS
jgi:hypothetical protein